MCVIAVKNKGSSISEETFKKMWDRNDDGAGFIARKGDSKEWIHEKGIMKYDEALEKVKPYLGEDSDIIVHLRIKSRGNITAELTHPFPYAKNDKEKRFIFHNGTVKILSAFGDCSDSGTLAELLTPVDNKSVERILESLVKEGNGRFVTFTQKNGEDADIKIYPDAESKIVDGVWFSNLKHLEERVVVQTNFHANRATSTYGSNYYPIIPSTFDAKDPNVIEILNYYIKKNNLKDNESTRSSLIDQYSISLMCSDFLKSIVATINSESPPDDPILDFFKI